MKPKHICISCNENYMPHAAALIVSVKKHCRPAEKIVFHVLCDDISQDAKHLFVTLNDINISIVFYDINADLFKSMPPFFGSHTAYFRLLIQDILPDDISRVLYLDCDTIVNSNLEALFETDISRSYAAATPLLFQYLKKYPYFNSGVLYLNLNLLRNDDVKTKCFTIAKNKHADPKETVFFDENILNEAFEGRVAWLPFHWNAFVPCEQKSLFQYYLAALTRDIHSKKSLSRQNIVHYISPKPWVYDISPYRHPLADFYWKALKETPFYEAVAREYMRQKEIYGLLPDGVELARRYELPVDLVKAVGACFCRYHGETIAEGNAAGRKLAVFGAGVFGAWHAESFFEQTGGTIDYFVDNSSEKIGTAIKGIPVLSIEDLVSIEEAVDVYICCDNSTEIIKMMYEHGIANLLKGSIYHRSANNPAIEVLNELRESIKD